MAFANQGRSIPWVGLRRTLRFQWRSSDREVMPRDLFCTRIIKGQLNLTVEDVFCIQWHQQATGYDVSFVSAETHQAVTASSRFCCTQMFPDLLHPDAEEAIRADASVRVTLVPGGGDLRVKLSQYTDDTTLLLGSDECVVRALEVLRILEGSQELGSTLANADMLSSVLHLAYVFPLPVAIRRPLARTIFDFLWGGRYEWVARGRMMSGLAEGGRDDLDLPLKLDTIFVASLLQDMASEVGHPASLGMKYFFLYAARGILNWSNVSPRSEQLPWHYAWVAKVVRGKVNPSPLLGVPSSVWVGVQAVDLSNGLKDLNWAGARTEWSGVEWTTERVAKGVEWEVTERMKLDVEKLGYHAAKEKWKVPGSAAPRCSRFCCTQMLKVLKGFSTPLHSPAEAIRADASVRVTLVPGGGDLRVKLSQYADETTLTIFNFLWGGRYEWVALGRMMSGLAEGGRDVPDLPLKLDTVFVASLLQDMASEVGHPASLGPRSKQLPWHYAWVAKWLRAHPKALEDGIWKQQRVLYRVVRGKVNPSPLLGVPSSVTVGVQAVGQTNGLKDLNWACLHRTLPVRDKIHRHGLGRSPLCPRPSCGAGETAYHVMWECSFTRQLWAKAKKVVGRAKPDPTLTWQVVKRGFVGAHIRSGWGILWLLLSLYKKGLWLARQELVRNEVEWSGLQRGWLRGSNGR
ncbi:hypothetical protein Q8A73_019235 [Channa argus]|nr:hypothetical protein Q8A73_019235 [Channa argus]